MNGYIIDQLIPKVSCACSAIRSVSHSSNTYTLRSIYFAYFDCIMKYGIIVFWGNSGNSRKIPTLQKKIIRIVASVKLRNLYRSLFKRLEKF
jgi:hypothetical protein